MRSSTRGILAFVLVVALAGASHGAGAASAWRRHEQASTAPNLDSATDQMVRELFAPAAGAKGLAGRSTVRFSGMGWETEAGIAGTSGFGVRASEAVRRSLASQGVALAEPGSKGVGGTVLRGAFKLLKGGAQVSLALVDANTGRVLSEARRLLRPESYAGLVDRMLPPDAARALELTSLVRRSLGEGPSAFPIEITTDRGTHAAYFEGERLTLRLSAARDCWVRIFHVSGSERRLTLLYPNRSDTSAFLAAGTTIVAPSAGGGAIFEVAPPYGVDAIVALASETPFEDGEWVSGQLSARSPGDLASRGVQRAGDYLAAAEAGEDATRGVLARGLLVRHASPVANGAESGAALSTTAGPDASMPSAPSDSPGAPTPIAMDQFPAEAAIPGIRPPRSNSPLARATCFFTTLPRPDGVR